MGRCRMNVIICDDDKHDREKLNTLIDKYVLDNNIQMSVSEYESGEALLESIKNGKCADIIFLDINMDNMDGLTLAKKIRVMMEDVPIILVTAFINYALDGYKVRASRFLVKDDLDKTFDECMDDILCEMQRKSKNIILSCVEGDIRFKVTEILMIETARHKNLIHTEGEMYQIYEKLDILEEMLKGYGFLRIHQSYLVNMSHVRSINSYELTLDNGIKIPVPKARYKEVKREYTLYVGKEL